MGPESFLESETDRLVRNDLLVKPLPSLGVDALLELAHEQVDADDGEDQPEDEADKQDVEDTGQGPDQGVHHYLHALHLRHCSQRSQSSESSHCLEDWDVSCAK